MLGVLVATILVFDPREGHLAGRPKYLLVVTGAVAALALLIADTVVSRRRARRPHPNPLRLPVAALLAATAVSAIASAHSRTAVYGYPGSYHGLVTTAALVVLFFAAARAFSGRDQVVAGLRIVWLGAGIPVLLFGVAQLVDRLLTGNRGWDWARPPRAQWTIGSTLGNPNHLAGLLVMLLPVGIVLAILAHRRQRALLVGSCGLAVAELAVTTSRGAGLAAAAVAAHHAVLLRPQLRRQRSQLAAFAAAAAVVIVLVLATLGPAGVTKLDPGKLLRSGPGSTIDQRFEIWAIAIRMAADHPVAGVGPDVFTVVFPAYVTERFLVLYGPFAVANGAHNVFLNTWAELGALGVLAFVALLAAAAAALGKTWRSTADDAGLRLVVAVIAAALVAFVVQACLNTQNLPLSLLFWVMLGLGLALRPDRARR